MAVRRGKKRKGAALMEELISGKTSKVPTFDDTSDNDTEEAGVYETVQQSLSSLGNQ